MLRSQHVDASGSISHLFRGIGITLSASDSLSSLAHLLLWDAPRPVALRVGWHASGGVSWRPATGRPMKAWGIIDGVQDGKIKDTRLIMDSLGLMMQLGVFPSAKA